MPEEGPLPIPTTVQMSQQDFWVHHSPSILQTGRVAHGEPEVPEGQDIDPEVLKKQIEAKDPYEPRLKPINQDKNVKGELPPWVVKFCGDKTEYA